MRILIFSFVGGAVGAFLEKRKADALDIQYRAERREFHAQELEALREGATLREARAHEFVTRRERVEKDLP